MTTVGFIGTGNFARQHAEVLNELGANIVACFGTNQEKTASFAKDFQCIPYDEALTFISSAIIDALYIAVPPFAHDGSIELKAVEQGIPFLCEKPVGLDLEVCKNIADKVTQANLITSSGYLLRYEPLFVKVKEIIDRNKISTVRVCSYSYMPEVSWWRRTELSGGMMVESGSHYIDLLRYLFGEITDAAAVISDGISKGNVNNCDIYDSMEGILKFQSGAIGSIGVTHLLNEIHARNDMLEVYGQDFALKVDLYKLRYKNEATVFYKEATDHDWNRISNATCKKDLLISESKAFLTAISQNNSTFIRSGYPDAVKSLKISLALNQSAKLKSIYNNLVYTQ